MYPLGEGKGDLIEKGKGNLKPNLGIVDLMSNNVLMTGINSLFSENGQTIQRVQDLLENPEKYKTVKLLLTFK